MNYTPKMFSQWSEYAARIEAALKNLKDPLAKETLQKLIEHHANVREARQKIEAKLPEREKLRTKLGNVRSRLRASIDGCVLLGLGFELDAIGRFVVDRSDVRDSATGLERLFRGEGEFGAQMAQRLSNVRSEHERVGGELARVDAGIARLRREYSAELAKLQGFIGAGRAVLTVNGSEVPVRRVGRKSKKSVATRVETPALPVAALGPAPTPDVPTTIAA